MESRKLGLDKGGRADHRTRREAFAVKFWEREREPFSMASSTLRLCQRDGRNVLNDHEAPFPDAPSRCRGRGVQ